MDIKYMVAIPGDLHSSIQGQSNNSYLCDSISLNFESNVVALGTSNTVNGSYTWQGKVEISYWNDTTKYWNHGSGSTNAVAQTIYGNATGETTDVKFGNEVSLNWDGDRLAVGAPGVNKVMVFDAVDSGTNKWATYVSNTLPVPSISSSAEFGYSVSLSQEDGKVLAVGAPGIDTVYVYEFNAANAPNEWGTTPVRTIQGSNSATGGNNTQLKNVIPKTIDSGGNITDWLWCHGIINRFGHKVRMTHFGDFLAIGAPGVNGGSTDSTAIHVSPSNTYDSLSGSTPVSFTTTAEDTRTQGQLGHIRVYTSPQDQSWGGSNVLQYGQTLQGYSTQYTNSSSRSDQPEFGTSCDVSWDGSKVVIGSPYFTTASQDRIGQVKTFVYNSDTSQYDASINTIVGNQGQNLMGMNVRLDYAGERLITGRLQNNNQESEWYSGGSLSVFDWAADRWYEITEPIRLEPDWPTYTDRSTNPCEITSGKIACIANPMYPSGNTEGDNGKKGEVRFYEFGITQSISGNNIVGGFVTCNQLFIGSNDNTTDVSQSKRISFGGTNLDNSYDQTFIENRVRNASGSSELLLFKRNDIREDGLNEIDTIRLKAADIRLDFHNGEHGLNDEPDTQRTRFIMTRGGQIAVGNCFYQDKFDQYTNFDVNCRSYFTDTLSIGARSTKNSGLQPGLNTNDERMWRGVYSGNNVDTTSLTIGHSDNTWYREPNATKTSYDSILKAFKLSDTDSRMWTQEPGHFWSNKAGGDFWFRLSAAQSSCVGCLAFFGYGIQSEVSNATYTGAALCLTSTGIQFEYEASSANAVTKSYTFNQDTWYHINCNVPARSWTDSDDTRVPGTSGTGDDVCTLQINGVTQTLTFPTGFAFTTTKKFDEVKQGFGQFKLHGTSTVYKNSVLNCYIAMMSVGEGGITNAYNSITPGEMCSIGGNLIIQGYLGVNKTNASYPLDIDGDINFIGDIRKNGVIQNIGSWIPGTNLIYYPSSGTTDKVGINTTTPQRYLDVAGTLNATNGGLLVRNGDSNTGGNNAPQIAFGHNGTDDYQHFIQTRHNSAAADNAIDFYVCDSTQNNTLASGVTHNLTLESGNVGIGTTNPVSHLHVYRGGSTGEANVYIQAYSDTSGNRAALFFGTPHHDSATAQPKCAIIANAVGWSRADLHFCSEITDSNDADKRASITNSRMMVDGELGIIGIGTSTPYRASLHVASTGDSQSVSYGYLNGSGSVGSYGPTGVNYSIWADGRIACAEFNAISDERIKKNIVDVNDSSALEKLRLLEPKTYQYKEEKTRGSNTVYGFIAQDVSNVLPYAINIKTGDIPNILTNSSITVNQSNSNVVEIRLDTSVSGLSLSNTSNINITTDKDEYLTFPVISMSNDNVITIENNKTKTKNSFDGVSNAYVHGERVEDFYYLNKDALWTVSTSALQEVDRQLQAEKTKVATLETQVADLISRVSALESA